MTCGCNDKCELPKALQINNPGEVTLFHRVDIPASQGDDTTYPPKNGLYRNVLLVYLANNHSYLYNSDGIPTRVDGPEGPEGPGVAPGGETGQVLAKNSDSDYDTTWVTQTSANDAKLTLTRNNTEIGDFTANASVDKTIDIEVPTKTSDLINDGETGESTYAEATDIADIWEEIEEIEAASDVTDVVGTYAELEDYDTSKLKDNDIIKVLEDETQNDQITYYRWDTDTETFTLIGAIGPYYTKLEADTTFQGKLTAGSNITIDANNEISATDTTYSDFTGATSSVAGAHGLVPAPTTSDPDKFLKGDGTWGTPPGTTYTAGTGIDISGNTIAVDTTQVSMKSEYTVKKSYTIDLTAQSTSNFYPVIFPRTQNTIDCEIHSQGAGSVDPYNQNYIHFNACAQGWTDLQPRKKLIILQEGAYASNEITIGCIGLGMHDGYTCVWLRGGKNYYFTCNFIAEVHTSTYTIGDETFSVGTNYYGGTNTNVEIVRTPNNFTKDVALLEDISVREVYNHYTYRPTTANTTPTGNGGMYTFQATSSMTTGKPKNDAHILQLEWDNTSGFDSQIALSSWDSAHWMGYRTMSNGSWGDWVYLLNDEAGSVKTANIDALAVTTAKIADGAITEAKINATDWAKKVNVASIDLTGQTITLLSLTHALGAAGTDYARWTSKTDGGSANISDKPTGSTNKSFVCEAICSRWASSSDYGYQLICRPRDYTNPYVTYIDQNTSNIVWSRLSPTVNDATLTITQNGTTAGTFTANSSTNTTIALTDTTYTAGTGIDITGTTVEVDDTVALIDDPTTSETPTPWVETSMIENDAVTPDKIDFSTMYISAPDGASNITVGSSGAIIQTLALPVGKWRVFSQFRLSAGGIGANTTRMFYTGFKYGDTMSSTTINEIPMNISGDTSGSGRALVSMTSKEINVTVAPYTISSYVAKGDLPGSDIMVYANPGIYMYALRVG